MYLWLWRHLPGGVAGKAAGMATLALAVVALLWFVVFPWVTPRLPLDQVMPGVRSSPCHSAPQQHSGGAAAAHC